MKVVVFGYSESRDRYSNMAHHLLISCGHESITVIPRFVEEFQKMKMPFDTLTMYVSKSISDRFSQEILEAPVKRVIFNPGAENNDLEVKLKAKGIETLHACTLVMLRTNQF